MKIIKVAIIQLNSSSDKERNISKAQELCKAAILKKADFILLPEVFNYREHPFMVTEAEEIPGPSLAPFIKIARENKICILAGSMAEKAPDHTKCFNTSVLINDQGKIAATYRKIHLFNVNIAGRKIMESEVFLSGIEPIMSSVFGVPVGLSICFDLRFSDLYLKYIQQGAKIICIPSSFTHPTGQAHWETLLRARAIEGQCFVLAPNQIGLGSSDIPCYGNSMIIDPWGKILARASDDKEEVLVADLDINYL
ncbi:carbon-nitrogen hydrolase family protein, partial [Candidatus Margulisiibacteriota bacterium]